MTEESGPKKIFRSLSAGNLCNLSYDEATSLRGYYEETTLHAAVAGGSRENVKKLMVMVDIDSTDIDSNRPLHVACMTKKASAKIVKSLATNKYADLDSRNITNNTPLHFACQTEAIEKVKILVKKGANINARNDDGDTPLLVAGKKKASDVVQYLLEMGADTMLANKENKTIYDVAQELGFSEMLEAVSTKTKSKITQKISGSTFSNSFSNKETSSVKLADRNKQYDDNDITKNLYLQLDNFKEILNQFSVRLDKTESKTDQVCSSMLAMESEFKNLNKKIAKQFNKKEVSNDVARFLETTEDKLKKMEEQFALFSKTIADKTNVDVISKRTTHLADLVDNLKTKQSEYDKKLTDAYNSLENTQTKINQINEQVSEEQRKTNKIHDSVTECTAKTDSLLQSQTHIKESISRINIKLDGTLRDMDLGIKENEAKFLKLNNMQAKIDVSNEHKEKKVTQMQRELAMLRSSIIPSDKDKLNSEIMKITQKVRRSSLPLDNQLSGVFTDVANFSKEMPKINVISKPNNKALYTTSFMNKDSQEEANHTLLTSPIRRHSLNKIIISEHSEIRTSSAENYEDKNDNFNLCTASKERVTECSRTQTSRTHQQNLDEDKRVQKESAKHQQNRQQRNSHDCSTIVNDICTKCPPLPSSTASNSILTTYNVQTEKPKSAKIKDKISVADDYIAPSTSVKMHDKPKESKLISIDNLQKKNSSSGRHISPKESSSKTISPKESIPKSISPKEICTGCHVYKGKVKKRPDCDHFRCDSCELKSKRCLKCNHPFRQNIRKPPSTPAIANNANDDYAQSSDQYLYTEKYDRQEDDIQAVSYCKFYHSAVRMPVRRLSDDVQSETKVGDKYVNCCKREGIGSGSRMSENYGTQHPQNIKYCRNDIKKSPPSVDTLISDTGFVKKRSPPATMEKDCSSCFLSTTHVNRLSCGHLMCDNCFREVKKLNCGHSVCLNCLRVPFSQSIRTCPKCTNFS